MADYITGPDLASFLEKPTSARLDNIAQRTNALIDEAWAAPRSPIPQWVVNIAYDVAIRAGRNPLGVTSKTRSFDDTTVTERFDASEQVGVYLTDAEQFRLASDTGDTASTPAPTGPKSIRMTIPGWSCPPGGYSPCC